MSEFRSAVGRHSQNDCTTRIAHVLITLVVLTYSLFFIRVRPLFDKNENRSR